MARAVVREATYEDYQGIAALQARHDMLTADYDSWRRLWADNPFILERPDEWAKGWVVEAESGVVGYLGSVPMAYEFRGESLPVVSGHAWVVDDGYRAYSVSLAQRFYAQLEPALFLTTTAVSLAGKFVEMLGGHWVPGEGLENIQYWVTRYPSFVARALRKLHVPLPGLFAAPAGLALRLADGLRGRGLQRPVQPERTTLLTAFDDRFDAFWQRLREAYPKRLMFVRDRQWLQWHFQGALGRGQAYVLVYEAPGEMLGYAVVIEREREGLRRAFLADLQFLPGHETAAQDLLATALSACSGRGVAALEIKGVGRPRQELFAAMRPRTRQLDASRFIFRLAREDLTEALLCTEAWDTSLTDGDASLF